MEKSNSGMIGHGMPGPLPLDVQKRQAAEEEAKRQKQTKEFANNSLPKTDTTTTTIHESKHFPFQIIEIITSDIETKISEKIFRIGVGGAFMSDKEFSTFENANKYIGGRPWELITNLICFTIQNAIEYEKCSKK